MANFDIIIIGAGPGGYVAAERAGAAGKKVLLIEKAQLGGVCLNRGCIPTKTLLSAAKHFQHARHSQRFGVSADNVTFDMATAQELKTEVVSTFNKGIEFLMKKFKVEVVYGNAKIISKTEVAVDTETYSADNIIIATGSRSLVPPIPGVSENPNVITSTGILNLKEIPKRLVVIGGGVIGVEFASFFSALDTEVTVIEMLAEILPLMDKKLAKTMRRVLKPINFCLKSKVERIEDTTVFYSDKKGKEQSIEADKILIAVGRTPNAEGLNLDELNIDNNRGWIGVDEKLQTSVANIYAIGDVNGRSLLAHSASRMAEVAVANICGEDDKMNYHAIPWAVYSLPEAAGCGMTEAEAKAADVEYKSATVQMRSSARFFAEYGPEPGVCNIIVEANSDKIIGIHMIGAQCSEMIWGAAIIIEMGLTTKQVGKMIFPHPTISEVIREAIISLNH